MNPTQNNIQGKIIRDTDVYIVEDNETLNNLTLSKTTLHPFQKTSGHSHDDLEEIYFFKSGTGRMVLGEETIDVTEGDIILIPDGYFHQVINPSDQTMEFICVFQKYQR